MTTDEQGPRYAPSPDECLAHSTYHPVHPGMTADCWVCGIRLKLSDDFEWLEHVMQPGEVVDFTFHRPHWFWLEVKATSGLQTQQEIEATRPHHLDAVNPNKQSEES